MTEKILALPEGDHICHGDFHPGNIILKSDGTAVVIDFMNGLSIGDIYLDKMDVQYKDIKDYVQVVSEYRRFEICCK